jgi:hypothetical protein
MRTRRFQRFLCLIALFSGAAAAASAEPLRLAVEAEGLMATNATANGQVVFFGVSREIDPDDVVNVVPHLEIRKDDDGDGRVSLPLGGPVALHSTWAAVDLAGGGFDAAAPEGFRLKKVSFRGRGLGKRPDGRDSVLDARGLAEILVVRPGVGAWALRLGDGGPGDEDGTANGRLEAALDRMTPLPGSPAAPQSFQKDDVVLLLDPNLLEITLIKVPNAL